MQLPLTIDELVELESALISYIGKLENRYEFEFMYMTNEQIKKFFERINSLEKLLQKIENLIFENEKNETATSAKN